MAKIAVELERAVAQRQREGLAGSAQGRMLASGQGWSICDILCTSGPQDRAFEEKHSEFSIAMVVAGTFQYRSTAGRALLAPGTLLLGDAGAHFECGHEHAFGDRCVSFKFGEEYFTQLAYDLGVSPHLPAPSLPPIKDTSIAFARVCAAISNGISVPWEEIALGLGAKVLEAVGGKSKKLHEYQAGAAARVTKVVRMIEHESDVGSSIGAMAKVARLSPYHFLRVFQQQTGLTPHQYLLRTRLRNAATRLAGDGEKIVDIAFACGFGDVSNFNRVFRREFGRSPRELRREIVTT